MADMPLGVAIKNVRASRNLTSQQVADRMGVVRTYVSKIENGHSRPTVESLSRFAAAMDIEPWKLLRYACKLQAKLEDA